MDHIKLYGKFHWSKKGYNLNLASHTGMTRMKQYHAQQVCSTLSHFIQDMLEITIYLSWDEYNQDKYKES